MKKIDKTKKNIKVDELTTLSRKELFNRFIEAGGKITEGDESAGIVKKNERTKIILNKDKKSAFKLRNDIQRNLSEDLRTRITGTEKKNPLDNKPGLLARFSHKLFIRLRLYLMNITDFSASNFNNKFFHLFNTEYKIALMGIKILYLEIFKQNHNLEYQIIYRMEKVNPFDVHLIEEISTLYNESELENIIKEYLKSPETVQPITSIKEQLLSIFKKIYILKPYEHNVFIALEKSIGYYIKATNKKSSEYNSKRKNLRNDLYIIFEKLFPALYWLFCRYHNKIIALGSPEIEALLKIKPDKKTSDKMKKNIPEPDDDKEVKNEKQPDEKIKAEETQTELSDDVKAGMNLIKHFIPAKINELRASHDKSNSFAHITENDKMLYIYLIFKEFDMEYSFLLTTNKINYKFEYAESGYINFKDKFLDFYDDIKKCMDLLKEYANSFDILLKVQNEKPLTSDRYIAYTKDLNDHTKRRSQAANSAKYAILTLMSEISNILRSLIDDINGSSKIIDNPHDIINFEIPADKNRKLNNKSIFEALTLAYQFAVAFSYRLTTGDLSGEPELKESEMESMSKGTEAAPFPQTGQNNMQQENKPSDDVIKEESIMDELDDIAKI